MKALFLAYLAMSIAATTASAHVGIAKHYRPGLMEAVAQKRGVYGPRYTSSVNCSDIGRTIYATLYDPVLHRWTPYLPFVVADCSAPKDRARHIREGLVMEVDYQTAWANHFTSDGRTRAVVLPYWIYAR